MDIFRSRSLSLFYRQLSTLLASGLPVVQAMKEIVNYTGRGRFRYALGFIQGELDQGGTVAGAFAKFPRIFPEWQVGVIEAGEKSGNLSGALTMIADQLEKNYSDTLKLMVGLAYPLFILVVALVGMPFLNIGGCGLSGCAPRIYVVLFIIAAACAAGYQAVRRGGTAARFGVQSFLLAVPLFGRLLRQFAITRFMRALRSLTAAGVPILTAWRVAAGACGNEVIRARLLGSMKLMETGTISDALAHAQIFPPYMAGMIASGEKSGSIVKMLDTAASVCEKENDAAIGILLKIIPVAVYMTVAAFVGMMLLSAYSGYYNSVLSIIQ